MKLDRSSPEKSGWDYRADIPIPEDAICFGAYVLIPQHHVLLRNGEPIPLGSRAMLLLIVMATRAGELLEKTELLNLVWPRLVVEECNLRAQVRTLRRTFSAHGDLGYIVTVPALGYRFVAPMTAQRPTADQHDKLVKNEASRYGKADVRKGRNSERA